MLPVSMAGAATVAAPFSGWAGTAMVADMTRVAGSGSAAFAAATLGGGGLSEPFALPPATGAAALFEGGQARVHASVFGEAAIERLAEVPQRLLHVTHGTAHVANFGNGPGCHAQGRIWLRFGDLRPTGRR